MNDRNPIRIVMAEDNVADVILFKEALESAAIRYELETCENGQEVLNRLTAFPDSPLPHLVVIDLNLPAVDGFQVLKSLRNDRRFDRIPLAVLTSSRAASDERKARDLGATVFISKPTTLGEFLHTVAAAVKALLADEEPGGVSHAGMAMRGISQIREWSKKKVLRSVRSTPLAWS